MAKFLRTLAAGTTCGGMLLIASGITAGASVAPTTGQPGAPTNTCGNPGATSVPGASGSAAGAPFNSSGQAGLAYAGNPNTASLANSNSTAAMSQYDIACFKVTSH